MFAGPRRLDLPLHQYVEPAVNRQPGYRRGAVEQRGTNNRPTEGICKQRRYAEAGASLWCLSFEAGVRPSDEAAAFVRQCGAAWARNHVTDDGVLPVAVTDRLGYTAIWFMAAWLYSSMAIWLCAWLCGYIAL